MGALWLARNKSCDLVMRSHVPTRIVISDNANKWDAHACNIKEMMHFDDSPYQRLINYTFNPKQTNIWENHNSHFGTQKIEKIIHHWECKNMLCDLKKFCSVSLFSVPESKFWLQPRNQQHIKVPAMTTKRVKNCNVKIGRLLKKGF